jgi:hypothetical protein
MDTHARFEYLDLQPSTGSFLNDVIAGLSAARKSLPPKYFYDAADRPCSMRSASFPSTTQRASSSHSPGVLGRGCRASRTPWRDRRIRQRLGPQDSRLDCSTGTRRVRCNRYIREQLRSAVAALSAEFAQVRMYAVCADYTHAVPLDELEALRGPRRIILFSWLYDR